MIFTSLTLPQVYARWDWLRAGLLQVIEKTRARFRPEDVYHSVRTGNAVIYAIGDSGFIVLQQQFDPDGPVIFVWALWCASGTAVEVKDDNYLELEKIARTAGAVRIRMHSPLKGWGREAFFEQVSTIFEHEVSHG